MIIKLSKTDRKMMADVARIFKNLTALRSNFDPRYYDFWRVELYSKFALLKKADVETIHTAMKSFSEMRKRHPSRDPENEFAELDSVIKRLEDFMIKKGLDIHSGEKYLEREMDELQG